MNFINQTHRDYTITFMNGDKHFENNCKSLSDAINRFEQQGVNLDREFKVTSTKTPIHLGDKQSNNPIFRNHTYDNILEFSNLRTSEIEF